MNIRCAVLIVWGLWSFLVSSWGQEDLLREFDRFVRQESETFEQTLRQMNKEFARYLAQPWKPYDTHALQSPQRDPDEPVRKPGSPSLLHPKAHPQIKTERTVPQPIYDTITIRPTVVWKDFSYFGYPLRIPFLPVYQIPLTGNNEIAVSRAWERAADVDFSDLKRVLNLYRTNYALNDWGFLQLVRRSVETIYGESRGDAVVFLTTYLMNQLTGSVRLGRANGQLVLLAEISEIVYILPQLTTGNQTFTLLSDLPLSDPIQIKTYDRSLPLATRSLSLKLPVLPKLEVHLLTHTLPYSWKDTVIPVQVNRCLIDFMNSIPQTDLRVYGNSGTSRQIIQLGNLLKRYINGKDTVEAAAILLDFVQNAFAYQSDLKQFGSEKSFFPDESLYYPYNDCEDRAILYSRLVGLLLGLKVGLVQYQGHVAAAVCFPTSIAGAVEYRSGSRIYTLCDPTYINAGVGECMPQYIGKGKLIELNTL